VKHYFSSDGMSRAVYTRKVQINAKNGKPIAGHAEAGMVGTITIR
jgi:hypothetical protein